MPVRWGLVVFLETLVDLRGPGRCSRHAPISRVHAAQASVATPHTRKVRQSNPQRAPAQEEGPRMLNKVKRGEESEDSSSSNPSHEHVF